jgi:adenylate kinase
MDAGRLVSDEVMIGIVRERLAKPDVGRGFILDGFPRTVAQAQALDALMTGRDPLVVVNIAVPADELARRTSQRRVCDRCGFTTAASGGSGTCTRCGGELVTRSDDSADVVRERLQVYERQTKPLVEYYRARPSFRVVNGNQPPDAVAAELRRSIDATRSSAANAPVAPAGEAADRL